MDPQPGGRSEGKEKNQPAGEGLKKRCCGQYIAELETPRFHLTAQGGAGGLRLALKWKPGVEGGCGSQVRPLGAVKSLTVASPTVATGTGRPRAGCWGQNGRLRWLRAAAGFGAKSPRAGWRGENGGCASQEGSGQPLVAAMAISTPPQARRGPSNPFPHPQGSCGCHPVSRRALQSFVPDTGDETCGHPLSGARPGRTSSSTSAELWCHLILRY